MGDPEILELFALSRFLLRLGNFTRQRVIVAGMLKSLVMTTITLYTLFTGSNFFCILGTDLQSHISFVFEHDLIHARYRFLLPCAMHFVLSQSWSSPEIKLNKLNPLYCDRNVLG